SMWIGLDFEDIVRLNPDAIILFSPREPSEADLFAPIDGAGPDPREMLGKIAELDINAVRLGRLAVIDDPLGLLPSTSFGHVGDEVAEIFRRWSKEAGTP
ncbi:MAG: hypothetical protein JKY96_03885, partial [Phycisphaerales bacterium]|nr:hypothetical protein [Phycisphaerales bacterium]